jgi:hypothetical protein
MELGNAKRLEIKNSWKTNSFYEVADPSPFGNEKS